MKKNFQFILFNFALIALLTACSIPHNISQQDVEKDIIGQTIDIGKKSWTFQENDPKEISILETHFDDQVRKATVLIDIKTQRESKKMSGKLLFYYNYAYMINNWKLSEIENITFKNS